MKLYIGTSGWIYADWKEAFYPKGLKQSEWLRYLAREFDTTEINNSFYRFPKQDYVRRHGPRGDYCGAYSRRQLGYDAAHIRDWQHAGKTVFVYFNNDVDGHAIDDARHLRALLAKQMISKEK